jgi:hypothetical protein
MPINIPGGSWITGFDIVTHIKKHDSGTNMRFAIDGGYYSDSHDPVGAATGRFTLDPSFLYTCLLSSYNTEFPCPTQPYWM